MGNQRVEHDADTALSVAEPPRAPASWMLSSWTWSKAHPTQALGVAAGALAFLRLLAISHGRLPTARTLLVNANLTELAGGLVLSASMLWAPMLAAVVVVMTLNAVIASASRASVGMGVSLCAFIGLVLTVRFGDVDLDRIADGGPSYMLAVLLLGAALGGVVASALAQARPGSPALERNAVAPETDAPVLDADESGEDDGAVAVAPGEPADISATDESPVTDESSPGDGEPETPSWRDRLSRWASALWAGFWVLWLVMLIIVVLLVVLSEPSQPSENLTIRSGGLAETETVHVIDDSGSTWVVMRRSDRSILSIDAGSVVDRYACTSRDLPWELTKQVHDEMIQPHRSWPAVGYGDGGRTARSVLDQSDPEPGRDDVDEDDVSTARAWVDAIRSDPPPCSPRWSSTELAVVRADLFTGCGRLIGCETRRAADSAAEVAVEE